MASKSLQLEDTNAKPCSPTRPTTKSAGQSPTPDRLRSCNTTPAHNAKRSATNSPRTTPQRPSLNKHGTPKSAPARQKTSAKRCESSLLGDFLLGRPYPYRARRATVTRRASLEAVKADMKAEFVAKLQAPNKVQDRVRQWQKTSAGIVIEDVVGNNCEKLGDTGQKNSNLKDGKNPGRNSSKSQGDKVDSIKSNITPHAKVATPKKKVINDSQWMKDKKGAHQKKESAMPIIFSQTASLNPPLEKKIKDWVKRTEFEELETRTGVNFDGGTKEQKEDQDVSRTVVSKALSSRHLKESPTTKVNLAKSAGTQTSLKSSVNKSKSKKRATPSGSTRTADTQNLDEDDSTRGSHTIKNSKEDASKSNLKPLITSKRATSKRLGEQQPSSPKRSQLKHSNKCLQKCSNGSSNYSDSCALCTPTKQEADEESLSEVSSSLRKDILNRSHCSTVNNVDLNEILVGNSAFSVLDLPVGAEAISLRKAPPKRNSSFVVPKVLKKVYHEGKRIVHESSEPSKPGPMHPGSIESWLKKTSDPFIDPSSPPSTALRESPHQDGQSRLEDIKLNKESQINSRSSPCRNLTKGSSNSSAQRKKSHSSSSKTFQPDNPSGTLKRSQATRRISSPKSGRKTVLKENIYDAFHGESVMKRPNSPNPYDFVSPREKESNHDSKSPKVPLSEFGIRNTTKKSGLRAAGEDSKIKITDDEKISTLSHHPVLLPDTKIPSTVTPLTSLGTNSVISHNESIGAHTSITQESTIRTTPSNSCISRKSKDSQRKCGVRRRLTKHSELISILSLRDTTDPRNSGSIRSACSVGTCKKRYNVTSIDDVLIALAEDESNYMWELDTLVDGVIPVLLSYVSSDANSTELFDTLAVSPDDTSFTQPVIDMGVALKNLRSHHKRIPLADAYAFILWADGVRHVYEEYLHAWRSGFEDIVVNLAPVSSYTKTALSEMKRDQNGDLLGEKGEKIVVSALLKKPMIRIKHINRALKSFGKFQEICNKSKLACYDYDELLDLSRRRVREERARKIDRQAWNAETTRARNLRTLNPAGKFEVNRLYQVIAKDYFSLELPHSTGQRMNCGVELVLRNVPGFDHQGDLLIFKKDDLESFLLFKPIPRGELSARLGNRRDQIIVMVRGTGYEELLILDAEDDEVALDWIGMLGDNPVPPPVVRNRLKINPTLASIITTPDADNASVFGALKDVDMDQTPIGERPSDKITTPTRSRASSQPSTVIKGYVSPVEKLKKCLNSQEFARVCESSVLDLTTADSILIEKGISPITGSSVVGAREDNSKRNHSQHWAMSGGLNPNSRELGSIKHDSKITETVGLDQISSEQKCSDLVEGKRSSRRNSVISLRDDGAPPPPIHKTPISETIEDTVILDLMSKIRKNRRTSSPLKHEYQPSSSSETSSSESSDDESYTGSSTQDEMSDENHEEDEVESEENSKRSSDEVSSVSRLYQRKGHQTLPLSHFKITTGREASAESLPQIFTAVLFQWNGQTGCWINLHAEACTLYVTDGLIECFDTDNSSSSFKVDDASERVHNKASRRLIVKQILTPVVQVRQSTAIDIEIKSVILTEKSSLISKSALDVSDTLRYRLFTPQVCDALYAAIHRSRLRNKTYLRLEEEARIKRFGTHSYDQAIGGSRRQGVLGFGRKNSYRASTRALSESRNGKSSPSTLTALQHLSGAAGILSLAKSSFERNRGNQSGAPSTCTGSSYSGGMTPPRTPNSHTEKSDSLYSSGLTVRNLGTSNIPFRLYYMLRNGHWHDRGLAFLTVSLPPPDMKQKAPLYNGPQKRTTITRTPIPVSEDVTGEDICEAGVMLDEVLGANLFVRMQRSGILLQTWEDVSSHEGAGGVRSFGSVAPRRHIWALQFRRAGDAEWCWQLCRSGLP
ncbi:Bgt-1844 [Blumeria graminis f. sp. tritici]|uniref:Bgt-1844 n=1 Tax=Blumeria graminis f. sp. tritici TaxID=62690 RepID=A0A9X9MGR4_BLUGR|nr:Bgt-1844 [Blumeria graminis f. sp. tritici]